MARYSNFVQKSRQMSKSDALAELQQLGSAIAGHPEGIGVAGLLPQLGADFPRRTLQRRLATLVAQKVIETSGAARALRYRTIRRDIGASVHEPINVEYQVAAESYVPLSPEGAAIKAHVRQARHLRQPVGYQLAFLEQYQPNHSSYLPEALRGQLHSLGRASAQDAPAGSFARDILGRLLIDLSWSSSRLEGNTYSRLDTERLIQFGEAAEGKDALETQMILNHKAAIEYLVLDPAHAVVGSDTVIALHALLSDGLMADPLSCGRLRKRAVEIGGSVYRPLALPQKLEEIFGITLSMAAEIRDPFEQSFFLMVHLPYLQPFEDVNKRVSRLAANIPLIRHNLSPLSFIDVPAQAYGDAMIGVYELARVELLRDVFVGACERSCQQYVAVRQQLVPPDTFRLRHRNELAAMVRAIVQGGREASETTIRELLPATLAAADRERFVKLAQQEFLALHQGNAVRFGLSPLEFAVWQGKPVADIVPADAHLPSLKRRGVQPLALDGASVSRLILEERESGDSAEEPRQLPGSGADGPGKAQG